MEENEIIKILTEYFDSISNRDYAVFFQFLYEDFKNKVSEKDLNYVFGISPSSTRITDFELGDVSESVFLNEFEVFKMDYSFTLIDNTQVQIEEKTFVFVFKDEQLKKMYFLPYIESKREEIFTCLPSAMINLILKNDKKNYDVELIPYPSFEDVFVKEIDPKAKFVFLPLATIKISNHSVFGSKSFHIISIWDTGDYEKEYFGDFRTDVNEISFRISGDKLEYKDDIKFPYIEHLGKAYKIIIEDFVVEKDNYINNIGSNSTSKIVDRGKKLILGQIPEFGDFEAGYYFERITSSLLSKYRFEKFGTVNSLFSPNLHYAHKITEWKHSEDDFGKLDFNKIGKSNLIDNILLKPDFIQNDEAPEGCIFIGQVDEWEYISSSSTNTYLFYDVKNEKQVQIFQWD